MEKLSPDWIQNLEPSLVVERFANTVAAVKETVDDLSVNPSIVDLTSVNPPSVNPPPSEDDPQDPPTIDAFLPTLTEDLFYRLGDGWSGRD